MLKKADFTGQTDFSTAAWNVVPIRAEAIIRDLLIKIINCSFTQHNFGPNVLNALFRFLFTAQSYYIYSERPEGVLQQYVDILFLSIPGIKCNPTLAGPGWL